MPGNRKMTAVPGATRTYGVYGLMEWQALIPARSCVVRVPFTGGAFTECGVRPATFATDNEVLAAFIEESSYFKSGRIRRIR